MIRRILRALLGLDRYEWVGIASGVIVLAALTGVLGPTLDADDAEHLAQAEREQIHYASQ